MNNKSASIELILFNHCNLNCSFCFQRNQKRSLKGLLPESYSKKIDLIKNFISEIPDTEIMLEIHGGEIFNDELPESAFSIYSAIAKEVIDQAEKYNKDLKIYYRSNLNFENIAGVKKLLDKTPGKAFLMTSYDFGGRPVNKTLMAKNLNFFQDYIKEVNMVMSMSSISALALGRDEWFEEHIYNKFHCFADTYIPVGSDDPQKPGELDASFGCSLLSSLYPNIHKNKKDLIDQIHHEDNGKLGFSVLKIEADGSYKVSLKE